MSGSGTDWVRLAELREDAADEEWEQAHPKLTKLRAMWKRVRIQIKLSAKEFSESARGQRLISYAHNLETYFWASLLAIYLLCTRIARCRPARHKIVRELSTKRLLAELELRGIDTSDFVERDELLEALCGPASEAGLDAEPAHDHSLQMVDKMV